MRAPAFDAHGRYGAGARRKRMTSEESLAAVERLIAEVSAALRAADRESLERYAPALRAAAARFALARQQSAPAGVALSRSWRARVAAIGATLTVQRECLARLCALTDRQVAGLLPAADAASTYAPGLRAGAARTYRPAG
ncbi:hypothetical protein D5039_18415 [Verminephrobacter aporrectodeae subsp. tuberculatae]|uniref:Flagellar protein FliT n=2 Tax=Verminephrobacter TaxID=364316 RepID=A0ABT3KXI9_9BURK|nr:hypothetical protein [Verminephrobacter aporrectodeae subsp. tuberculatae]